MSDLLSSAIAASFDCLPGGQRQALFNEMRTGALMSLVKGAVNQKRIAAASRNIPRKSIEGIGRLRMRVDADLYHLWGQKYGYECWKDKQFLNEMERDNESLRVNCGGTRLQVGFSGSKRFSKSYA